MRVEVGFTPPENKFFGSSEGRALGLFNRRSEDQALLVFFPRNNLHGALHVMGGRSAGDWDTLAATQNALARWSSSRTAAQRPTTMGFGPLAAATASAGWVISTLAGTPPSLTRFRRGLVTSCSEQSAPCPQSSRRSKVCTATTFRLPRCLSPHSRKKLDSLRLDS